jgi:DNA-binding transcriptional ArsR family regulator
MNAGQLATARRLLDALCNAERLVVAGRLAERPWSVTELAGELNIRPQNVLRHLTALEGAGLVFRDGGRPEQFWLDVDSLRSQAAELRPEEAEAFTDEAEDTARILRAFFDGERLTHLPVQRSRRLVVLRWLADHFEPGRIYQEAEANDILGAFNSDYALLRRELVDEGFMARDHGLYWRSRD